MSKINVTYAETMTLFFLILVCSFITAHRWKIVVMAVTNGNWTGFAFFFFVFCLSVCLKTMIDLISYFILKRHKTKLQF